MSSSSLCICYKIADSEAVLAFLGWLRHGAAGQTQLESSQQFHSLEIEAQAFEAHLRGIHWLIPSAPLAVCS